MLTICSSMSSLSSMSSSCLQQAREHHHHSSYPYMFHDPLHSLSSTYNHSRVAAACNPAVAHAQSTVNTHPGAYPGTTAAPAVPTTGTGLYTHTRIKQYLQSHVSLGGIVYFLLQPVSLTLLLAPIVSSVSTSRHSKCQMN